MKKPLFEYFLYFHGKIIRNYLAVKGSEIKLTERIFQAPEKLNVLDVFVNPLA